MSEHTHILRVKVHAHESMAHKKLIHVYTLAYKNGQLLRGKQKLVDPCNKTVLEKTLQCLCSTEAVGIPFSPGIMTPFDLLVYMALLLVDPQFTLKVKNLQLKTKRNIV